jgi:hypothetical protein
MDMGRQAPQDVIGEPPGVCSRTAPGLFAVLAVIGSAVAATLAGLVLRALGYRGGSCSWLA